MSKTMKSFSIVPDCGRVPCLGLCAICETVLESFNKGIEYSEDNGMVLNLESIAAALDGAKYEWQDIVDTIEYIKQLRREAWVARTWMDSEIEELTKEDARTT